MQTTLVAHNGSLILQSPTQIPCTTGDYKPGCKKKAGKGTELVTVEYDVAGVVLRLAKLNRELGASEQDEFIGGQDLQVGEDCHQRRINQPSLNKFVDGGGSCSLGSYKES